MPRDDVIAQGWTAGRVATAPDHNVAVRVINDTLRGPVADIFRSLVPAFGELAGGDFYDAVMTSSQLLDGCIRIFRRHRDAFKALLVDSRGRPVGDDFVRLRCGRSVHDIVAMIVRTHAKRHFKAVLGGNPDDPGTRAGHLYQAMNEYLIHDWQVPLVPHYAPLPVSKVIEMGPRLLDIREAELLDAITAAAGPPPAPTPPPGPRPGPGPAAARRTPPTGAGSSVRRTPQEDFWWEALADRSVTAVLGQPNGHEARELVAAMAGVNDAVRGELFAGLSLSTVQAAAFLAVAFRTLGRQGFAKLYGTPGQPHLVAKIATRLRQRNVGSRTDLRTLVKVAEGVAGP